jgi:hypothetical protein
MLEEIKEGQDALESKGLTQKSMRWKPEKRRTKT